MSIGETLAEARRQAGLTITQVSQQTRIRESIIRAIEQGDFSGCGGDFYARGHIRSIAGAVGVDPVPLIREYDEEHGPPGAMRASQIFEPATPIKIREPRNLHLGWVLAVAVLALAGFGAYHFYPRHTADPAASSTVNLHSSTAPTAKASTASKPAAQPKKPTVPEAVIRLTAAQDCWVGLNGPSGHTLYQGVVLAGSTKTWNEKNQVSLVIGNPPGITLTVNGKTQHLSKGQVARLNINPFSKTPVQVG
ncbi:MAG TPA: RodZ domain-containing protein [Trebonia sp.]|nr:RodZ domain-containing protein [Trebonia sp.]